MPAQYEAIRDSFIKKGMGEKEAKTRASKIFIAKGKGGSPSSRASSLHDKPKKGKKRPVAFGSPMAGKGHMM